MKVARVVVKYLRSIEKENLTSIELITFSNSFRCKHLGVESMLGASARLTKRPSLKLHMHTRSDSMVFMKKKSASAK